MIKKIFATVLCCLLAGGAWAHDFSLTVASGQTLYFNILESAASVEVTYPNHDSYPVNGWGGYTRPVGNLRIPSSVVYNGVTYSVTTVGQLAFYGCTGLTSVVMGEGITVLGNSAFNGCTALTTAVVPSSIDTIGLRAFGECNQLAHVWCNKSTLPNASAYMFYNISLDGRTLHVPAQALSLYSAAAPWSGFGTILGDGPMVALSLLSNDVLWGSVSGGGSFVVGSVADISALPNEGYSFICWNDGDTQNPRQLTLYGNMSLTAMFFPVPRDTVEVHDTVVMYDTVVLHDTASVALHRLQVFSSQASLGAGVGTTEVPEGTAVEICALPLGGSCFTAWDDGSTENPRRVTVTDDMTFTAFFEQLSIVSLEAAGWRVNAEGREVVVTGANGMKIVVYDMEGRLVAAETWQGATEQTRRLRVPTAGVYVVRVGETGAVKVTVE